MEEAEEYANQGNSKRESSERRVTAKHIPLSRGAPVITWVSVCMQPQWSGGCGSLHQNGSNDPRLTGITCCEEDIANGYERHDEYEFIPFKLV